MIRTIILFFIASFSLSAQDNDGLKDSNFLGLGFSYGIEFPAADLGNRFGSFFNAGLSLDLFSHSFNGIFSLEGHIFFGNNVNENVVEPLQLETGAVLGNDGGYADLFLRMRGTYLGIYAKKIIIKRASNPQSGLALGLGIGLIEHRVRLTVETGNAPQFDGEYAKGYDRFSMGPALKQTIDYLCIGKNKNLNFSAGLTFMQGFTSAQRPLDFDTKLKDESSRFDLSIGLNLKWYLPLKDTKPAGEIFY